MQPSGSGNDDARLTFVDRPKASLKIVSLAVSGVSGFLLYKALVEPPPLASTVWMILGMFALCLFLTLREFMLRPVRVTTVCPWRRVVVLQETAPWRKRQVVASIPPAARFEIFKCESDNDIAYGVRIRSTDNGLLTVAEYVSKERAEHLAREANASLFGGRLG